MKDTKNIFVYNFSSFYLLLLMLFLSFGQIARLSFFNQQINIYVYEILIALYVLRGLMTYKMQPLQKDKRVVRSLLLFLVYLSLSWCISIFQYPAQENLVSLLYILRLWMYSLFFIYLLFEGDHWKKVSAHYLSITLFIGLTICTSFIQYWFYPDLRNLEYLGWDPHLYRMFGVFFDPPVAAGVYGLSFLYIMLEKSYIKKISVRFIIAGILLIMILLTYSRGVYLALLLVTMVYCLQQRYLKQLLVFVLLFFCVVFFLPKKYGEGVNLLRTATISSRITDYNEALEIWQKHPLFGVGYNHIRAERRLLNRDSAIDISHAGASFHSSFLIILATGGVIGLLLFINFMYSVVQLGSFSFYSSLFLSIMSLTDNLLLHPFILCLWFILLCFTVTRPFYTEQ